ncbi:MAG: hypothetical protein ACI3ZB_01375 [Prevotella sp.]
MRKFILTNIMLLVGILVNAQTDVSKYYLTNYDFNQYFDYTASQSTAVAQELLDVKGWTSELTANYTIVGTYEYGFSGTFNGASVPATGYDGNTGGGLAISTGWEQTFAFYQTVTLPAGTYTLNVPTYNGGSATPAESQVAWVPASGTSVNSTVTSYAVGKWTLDKITFTLTKTTTGKIRFGMKAAEGGSANSAKLVVDYVQLVGEDMAVDKTELLATIATANSLYADGSGVGAQELLAAITAAQAVADAADAGVVDVLEANLALRNAVSVYRENNVSEDNPLDKTEYIANPSFEDGTKGWTCDGLVTQTNSSFTKKAGSTYIEKWVSSGNKVGDASVSQTVTLPNGVYVLTVGAQNLNQASSTQKCTGVVIFADDSETDVYTPADYSVKFTNLTGETVIGYRAVGATGNWLAVDNFRLSLVGYVTESTLMTEMQRLIANAESVQSSMMSRKAADELATALVQARAITADSEEADIQTAVKAIKAAIKQAGESVADYNALAEAIGKAEAAYDAGKNEAEALLAEIDKAKALAQDADAKAEDLYVEIEQLDKAVLAFNIANATAGTGTAPAVTFTHKYVATGATEALVRATMTGSNILERGVCWSTEHNPIVLDNRTTKSFSLNGYIYHIKGMKPATVYYVRPYVMNSTYTVAYGDEIKIVTHPQGGCTWSWNEGAPDEAANTRCRNAIKQTIDYFNEWTGIRGFHLSGNYGSSTPTADCSYGGWMRIGPNSAYQAIGTVLHETGHGVGVGTHWIWYNCADTRENTSSGKWLGREANDVLNFLENKVSDDLYFTGDRTHGWGANATYDWLVNGADKDKHSELQYIGGMCILYGLFIDGLCPTSSHVNGIAGYTYNFDDSKKYYLMNKHADRGLGEGLLAQNNAALVGWKRCLANETISDSAAWYLEFVPSLGYYRLKNAATGKYLSHTASSPYMSLKQTSTPSATEQFQLMPDRTDVTIGVGSSAFSTHGYWLTWNDGSNKAMGAKTYLENVGYGMLEQTTFNYSNSATAQQWIIFSEDELEAYRQAAIATGIESVSLNEGSDDGSKKVVGIWSADGVAKNKTGKGLNIIRYSDGTTRKILVK